MRGVDRQRAEPVAEIGQRAAQGGKIGAALGREQAEHVLERDQARRAAFGAKGAQQRMEAPEGRRARARKPGAGAGERQVLAGKRRPGEIGAAGQVAGAQRRDIGEAQFRRAPVVGVGARLARIEVVGEQAAPGVAEPRPRHAAAAEEFIEAGSALGRRIAHAARVESFRLRGDGAALGP